MKPSQSAIAAFPKIENNIPLPNSRSRYGFEKMKVGDSMLFKENTFAANNAATQFFRNRGWKLMRRSTPDGLRIWRAS